MTYNIVYHGTSKKRAQDILVKGYDFSKLGEKTKHPLPGLSTTISESEAKEHAVWAAEKFNDEPVIIEYNITGMKIMPGSKWTILFNELEDVNKVINKAKKLGFEGIQLFDLDEEEGLEEYEILLFKEPKRKKLVNKTAKMTIEGEFAKQGEFFFHGFNSIDYLLHSLMYEEFGRQRLTSIGTEYSLGVPYHFRIWFKPKIKVYPVFYTNKDHSIAKQEAAEFLGINNWLNAQVGPMHYKRENEWYINGKVKFSDIEIEKITYPPSMRRIDTEKLEELKRICIVKGYSLLDDNHWFSENIIEASCKVKMIEAVLSEQIFKAPTFKELLIRQKSFINEIISAEEIDGLARTTYIGDDIDNLIKIRIAKPIKDFVRKEKTFLISSSQYDSRFVLELLMNKMQWKHVVLINHPKLPWHELFISTDGFAMLWKKEFGASEVIIFLHESIFE